MVTYSDLFTFVIMLCAIITLAGNNKHKKCVTGKNLLRNKSLTFWGHLILADTDIVGKITRCHKQRSLTSHQLTVAIQVLSHSYFYVHTPATQMYIIPTQMRFYENKVM